MSSDADEFFETYAFLDCGNGKRLERFGPALVARPAPAAVFPPALSASEWNAADLTFSRENGWQGEAPPDWRIRLGTAVLNLRPASGGQVGVFPEHAAVCHRLETMLAKQPPPAGGWRVLNAFAHTGLVTMRLAALPDIGEIVHLDAAPNAVRQARENADASGLAQAPVRWLTDDAMGFMAREIRRGRVYDMVIADPPAYGRNRKTGGEWKLERDLPALLGTAGRLLSPNGVLCLTCHPTGWDAARLERLVKEALPGRARLETSELALTPEAGGPALPAGYCVLCGI